MKCSSPWTNPREHSLRPCHGGATVSEILAELRIRLDHAPRDPEVLRLARAYNLTAYDAVYLELALREGRSLASPDRKLAGAAQAEGVDTIGS